MLEVYRRVQWHDVVLAVLSTGIIVYFCWPDLAPKQRFSIQDSSGKDQTIVVTVGSDNWHHIIESHKRWLNSGIVGDLAINAWRLELADHYVEQSRYESANSRLDKTQIQSVPRSPSIVGGGTETRSAEYLESLQRWSDFRLRVLSQREKLEQRRIQRQVASRDGESASAPIVVGRVFQPGKQRGGFAVALGAGLAVGGLFLFAGLRWPVVRFAYKECRTDDCPGFSGDQSGGRDQRIGFESVMRRFQPNSIDQSVEGSAAEDETGVREISNQNTFQNDFYLDLPARWFKLNQSAGVTLRRIALCSLVTVAMGCALI